jgi:serine/threonine protein kinase
MEGLERYKEIKELGKGAQGTVVLAFDTMLERQVAIKSLHTSLTENDVHKKRFKEESKILASISNHPSIITIYEFIVNDSGCHLIMEYFDGHPLDTYIQNITGPIEEVKAIAIFSQILDAMKYLHQKKIIHRDIKPSNIMINKEGKVQLLDFGIAKNTENDPSLTVVGESAGYTPMYMSPEHCNGAQITNQSDIYSLGVTLWQMLTGVAPYEGLTQGQIYMKVASEPLPSVQSVYEHVSVKMNAVVQKATHKTPKNRYKTCNAFLKAINDVKNHINSPETVFLHKLSVKIENDLEGDILMNHFAHKGSEYAESFAANTPITIVVEKDGYKKFEKTLFLSNSEHLDIALQKDRIDIALSITKLKEKLTPYFKGIKPNLIILFSYLKLTSALVFQNIQLKLKKKQPEFVAESISNLSEIKSNRTKEVTRIKRHKKEFLVYFLILLIFLTTLISLISTSPITRVDETFLEPENSPVSEKGIYNKGTVVDEDNSPLPGASVLEKGTKNGTETDFDGKFSLNAKFESGVLLISFIGYKTLELPYSSAKINIGSIQLEKDGETDKPIEDVDSTQLMKQQEVERLAERRRIAEANRLAERRRIAEANRLAEIRRLELINKERKDFYDSKTIYDNIDSYSGTFKNNTSPSDSYFVTAKKTGKYKLELKVFSYKYKKLINRFIIKGQIKNQELRYNNKDVLFTQYGYKTRDGVRCHRIDIRRGPAKSNLGNKTWEIKRKYLGNGNEKRIRLIDKD